MASNRYVLWPTHRKKAAEQRRRCRKGVNLYDLRMEGIKPTKRERLSL